ncbi:hypothetical protein [Magnetospirillum sulfuroxidans]|uniref:Uncharacterized protein n=1 Tax=Magnetospirillum sulfuroxidans TaxID=611300 RepID=A0ABS5IER2_9PROT|nr:hypothetical protein [Magnetospirillum sulfuroxidans]MBR9972902.1 hypothetical protein [Magnetospirillum sulfuroxidans]
MHAVEQAIVRRPKTMTVVGLALIVGLLMLWKARPPSEDREMLFEQSQSTGAAASGDHPPSPDAAVSVVLPQPQRVTPVAFNVQVFEVGSMPIAFSEREGSSPAPKKSEQPSLRPKPKRTMASVPTAKPVEQAQPLPQLSAPAAQPVDMAPAPPAAPGDQQVAAMSAAPSVSRKGTVPVLHFNWEETLGLENYVALMVRQGGWFFTRTNDRLGPPVDLVARKVTVFTGTRNLMAIERPHAVDGKLIAAALSNTQLDPGLRRDQVVLVPSVWFDKVLWSFVQNAIESKGATLDDFAEVRGRYLSQGHGYAIELIDAVDRKGGHPIQLDGVMELE